MDALIFIDTNIFLDFYRIFKGIGSLSLLEHVNKNSSQIITSVQVEMEYYKRRQNVILESLNRMELPKWQGLTPPALFADTETVLAIDKHKKAIITQHKKLKRKTEAILKNPLKKDPIYKILQSFFKNKGPFHLTREMETYSKIQRLARDRFMMGYPPRKERDTSMGDAINWEWILWCAKESGKNIIIVSRDGDYGEYYKNKPRLNDWLLQEFKERIGIRRKLFLTDRLAEAFKLTSIAVTKKEEEAEKESIKSIAFLYFQEAIKEALSTLPEREAMVLRLRFGLDDGIPRTLKEIGTIFDVSPERIRQIEAIALRKLRHPLRTEKIRQIHPILKRWL